MYKLRTSINNSKSLKYNNENGIQEREMDNYGNNNDDTFEYYVKKN